MTEALLTLLVIGALLLVATLVAVGWWRSTLVQRERHRIDVEMRLAEWQLQAITRSAMQQMLNVARRQARDGDR